MKGERIYKDFRLPETFSVGDAKDETWHLAHGKSMYTPLCEGWFDSQLSIFLVPFYIFIFHLLLFSCL